MHVSLRPGAVITSAVILAATIAVRAQQGPPPGTGAAPAPRPLIPVAASSLVLLPDTYVGENVSMTCTVEAMLSRTVFTVDQDKTASSGKEVLVIAPYLQTAVDLNSYVTVQGEVFKFDPAEVARRGERVKYVLDLPPDVAARYVGRPAVFATGVITSALVDVGKRLPPPLTPAEQTLRAAMISINTTNTALRGSTETDIAKIKEGIATLRKNFTDAQSFFKSQNATDAIGWAGDALTLVGAMETAAAASPANLEDVRAAATKVGGLCGPCHNARRERLEDGSFRFRSGG